MTYIHTLNQPRKDSSVILSLSLHPWRLTCCTWFPGGSVQIIFLSKWLICRFLHPLIFQDVVQEIHLFRAESFRFRPEAGHYESIWADKQPEKKTGKRFGVWWGTRWFGEWCEKNDHVFCLAMVMVADVVEVISSPNPDFVCFFHFQGTFIVVNHELLE